MYRDDASRLPSILVSRHSRIAALEFLEFDRRDVRRSSIIACIPSNEYLNDSSAVQFFHLKKKNEKMENTSHTKNVMFETKHFRIYYFFENDRNH